MLFRNKKSDQVVAAEIENGNYDRIIPLSSLKMDYSKKIRTKEEIVTNIIHSPSFYPDEVKNDPKLRNYFFLKTYNTSKKTPLHID